MASVHRLEIICCITLLACGGRPQAADSSTSDSGSGGEGGELTGWKDISAGHYHSCGIDESGSVLCWGQNDYGQTDAPSGEFVSVSAGSYHSCAVDTDGVAHCWGWNDNGQSNPAFGDFVFIGAGGFHTCAGARATRSRPRPRRTCS